jgi:prevent-host-death family protein
MENGAMGDATVGISELRDKVGSIIDRVEEGEAISVTRRGRPVARIVSTNSPPHLSALIADGTVRAPEGPRYLPTKPAKPQGRGKSAAAHVTEARR